MTISEHISRLLLGLTDCPHRYLVFEETPPYRNGSWQARIWQNPDEPPPTPDDPTGEATSRYYEVTPGQYAGIRWSRTHQAWQLLLCEPEEDLAQRYLVEDTAYAWSWTTAPVPAWLVVEPGTGYTVD